MIPILWACILESFWAYLHVYLFLRLEFFISMVVVAQAIGTRIKLAHALAQQWFGIYISPDSPADGRRLLLNYFRFILDRK